jgi:hypothetical protein
MAILQPRRNGTQRRDVSKKGKTSEGRLATAIESQTAKLPSDLFLWLAGGSVLTSLGLQLARRREQANFVGQWAPTLLLLGLYNKMVKLWGHG